MRFTCVLALMLTFAVNAVPLDPPLPTATANPAVAADPNAPKPKPPAKTTEQKVEKAASTIAKATTATTASNKPKATTSALTKAVAAVAKVSNTTKPHASEKAVQKAVASVQKLSTTTMKASKAKPKPTKKPEPGFFARLSAMFG